MAASVEPQSSGLPQREPLTVPPGAKAVHTVIREKLVALIASDPASCADKTFVRAWQEIGSLADVYQYEIISQSSFKKTCTRGCRLCCSHWVNEVYSFEAEIIVDYLRKYHDRKIPGIIETCREDVAVLGRLLGLVEAKLGSDDAGDVDKRDLLLSIFYQMGRPCPLLDDGICMVYEVRPLTCRNYVSFGDPEGCRPESINEPQGSTFLFGFEDETLDLLEILHRRFARVEDERALRALLLRYGDA